jgi:cytochrome P450 family 4 subfamily V
MCELVVARMFNPFIWYDPIHQLTQHGRNHKRCLKTLHDFTKKVILERNEEFENCNYQSQKRIAFLDMLLKAKHEDPTISFDDIQEEVDTFMFEGHDTTAAATSWACHLIGSNPDVQKKLHEEIDDLFGTSDRPLTNDDFKELKYLECCIKEALRLFPSVPFYGRTISEDAYVGDYKVLQGCSAFISSYLLHRDEKYYPDPEKFDPDRFLPQNSKDRHPYAYIPFSAGRRNCIGQRFALMEMKVVLSNILRKFEIKSLKTSDELKPSPDLIIRPTNGIPVTLKLRY